MNPPDWLLDQGAVYLAVGIFLLVGAYLLFDVFKGRRP